MAQGVDFPGSNQYFGPPKDKEDAVAGIKCFRNTAAVITCWELSDKEIEEIVRTRRVYCSMFTSPMMFPHFVGGEDEVREVNADYGLWKKES